MCIDSISFGYGTEINRRDAKSGDVLGMQDLGEPFQRALNAVFKNDEDCGNAMLCGRPQSRDGVVRRAISNNCDNTPLGQSQLHSESGRKTETKASSSREKVA